MTVVTYKVLRMSLYAALAQNGSVIHLTNLLGGGAVMNNIHKITMSGFLAIIMLVSLGLTQVYAGKQKVLRLAGTATGEECTVPEIEDSGTTDALCFTVGLVDMTQGISGNVVGTATDALSDIVAVGDGLALVGTTTFNLPEGQIVSRGLTTVQPTTHGSASATHITGAIPSPGDNSILSGTKKYKNATGTVRLSGAVNMTDFPTITFDCLFVIDLD